MNIVTVTEPAAEPVSLSEMYDWLRLDATGSPLEHPDDTMLEGLIQTARENAEAYTRRAFIEQTIRLVLPAFTPEIELRRPPLISVASVRYYDADNVLTTVDSSNYVVASAAFVPVVKPVTSWPATAVRKDAVWIDYVVGYASDASPAVSQVEWASGVPQRIKDAIKIGVQLLYDELAPEKRAQLERTHDRLLSSIVVHSF